MDSDDAKDLLDGLVLTARLTQADVRARFTRSHVFYIRPVPEDNSWRPSDNDDWPSSVDDIDTSNFYKVPLNPKSSGAHLTLRHQVTKRLAEHPEQFTALSASELRALGTYFALTERPDLWDPLAIERKQPEIVSRVLAALKKVDRTWYLSLFEGHLSLGGQCGKDYCTGFCGLGLQP
jgi:hypothetical protein